MFLNNPNWGFAIATFLREITDENKGVESIWIENGASRIADR
jgi:hypothetical protein